MREVTVAMEKTFYWIKASLFAAVIVAIAIFLAVTDRDESAPEHQRQASVAASPDRTSSQALKLIASFDLPGPSGKRFDYLTIDYDHGYLLSAHLGAGLLYVIDLKTNKVVSTIPDVPGVEGVEYVPELQKVYTSDWHENKIGVIDLRQMKVITKIPTEEKPDGSAYAAAFHKLYVSDERGKAEAVIDVTQDKPVKTLHFKSETGMPQYDPVAKLVYVNLQDLNTFAVIDPATDTVVGEYPVRPCKGNHGMALDPEHHRAFLSCEDNNLMAVFNLGNHQVITTLPMADGPDVIKFDPGLKRIYVACYSGAISVFQQDDPDHYRKVEDFPTQHKVHSLAVDERTHRVYAPEEQENSKPVARMIVYEPVHHE
jgi:YVTN family beta-propeller protein